jgi:hypothetical protein
MTYVAVLRARRVLSWFFGVFFALIAILFAATLHSGGVDVQVHGGTPAVPLNAILIGSAFAGFIVAPFLAGGLSGDIPHYPIAWTKPVPRTTLASRNVLVDLTALGVTYAVVIMVCLAIGEAIAIAVYRQPLTIDAHNAPLDIALALGTAVMWYGLVFAGATFFPGRGGTVAGASWAVFVGIPTFAVPRLPQPIHGVFAALTYVDPLAYIGGVSVSGGRAASHALVFGGAQLPCAIGSWTIGLAAIAAGIWLYTKREV